MLRGSWRSQLLKIDGLFLIASGLFGLTADILSYSAGTGPFGPTFIGSPLVIGVVEAHGLAMLTGIAAVVFARGGGRYWHLHLAVTHLLLGVANIAFFDVFRAVDGEVGGVAVTAVHFAFVVANAVVAVRAAPHAI